MAQGEIGVGVNIHSVPAIASLELGTLHKDKTINIIAFNIGTRAQRFFALSTTKSTSGEREIEEKRPWNRDGKHPEETVAPSTIESELGIRKTVNLLRPYVVELDPIGIDLNETEPQPERSHHLGTQIRRRQKREIEIVAA